MKFERGDIVIFNRPNFDGTIDKGIVLSSSLITVIVYWWVGSGYILSDPPRNVELVSSVLRGAFDV